MSGQQGVEGGRGFLCGWVGGSVCRVGHPAIVKQDLEKTKKMILTKLIFIVLVQVQFKNKDKYLKYLKAANSQFSEFTVNLQMKLSKQGNFTFSN